MDVWVLPDIYQHGDTMIFKFINKDMKSNDRERLSLYLIVYLTIAIIAGMFVLFSPLWQLFFIVDLPVVIIFGLMLYENDSISKNEVYHIRPRNNRGW